MSEASRARLAFERLTAAHTLSAAGDALVAIALAGTLFFNLSVGEARPKVALYLLLTMAPFSLLSPLVGPLIDRRRGARRLAIVLAGAGRATLALVMSSSHDTLLLFPAAFGVLVLSRAHGLARIALVPGFVEPEGFVPANARLAKGAVLGGVVAAVPGVAVDRILGAGATLVMAAVAFALTTVAALALPRPAGAPAVRAEEDVPGTLPERVRRAAAVNAILRALGGFLLLGLAFGLKTAGVAGAGFALVLAAAGAGSFAGAALVPRLRRASNEEWLLVVSLIAGGGAAIIASRSFGLDLAAVVGGVVGFVSSTGRLAFDSMVQREAPEAARGRTLARFETAFQIAWVGGAALPVVFPIPIGVLLGLTSAGFLGSAAWFLVSMGTAGRRGLSA